jgi:cell division septation protein DedD
MPRRYNDDEDDEDLRPSRPDFQFEMGTKGVVSLFAALVILCGLFWAFGFTIGKHSVPTSFSLGDNPATAQDTAPTTKPAAGRPLATEAPAAVPPNPSDLTAAEVNQTPQTLVPGPNGEAAATALPPTGNSQAATAATPSVAQPPASTTAQSTVQPASLTTAPAVHSYAVQVFAGAKQGDALNLAAALKARQYPVFILKPGTGGDGLYRVQIGPYTHLAEAQQMRERLAADGYNAVIK